MTTTLNVIVVDDEALARQRLRTLLGIASTRRYRSPARPPMPCRP